MKTYKKITTRDTFGNPVTREGEILGERTYGYNLPSGGWSLYAGREGKPADFLVVRWKGKHKRVGVNKETVLKIE